VLGWLLLLGLINPARLLAVEETTYDVEEILQVVRGVFGSVGEGLAQGIEKVFADLGPPNAYIAGEEKAGAFVVGVRYGQGQLFSKSGPSGLQVYWQGPSAGFDFGGSMLTQVFILVYHLSDPQRLFQRFPGVEGSFYFVAGVGVNYYNAEGIELAPLRTGFGFRQGASVGYLHFTKKRSWVPF
jgi:hypothetical protein